MHVRGGDIVGPGRAFFERALARMEKERPGLRYLVFTNDKEAAKEALEGEHTERKMTYISEPVSYTHLTMPGVIARQIASQQIDHHKMCKSLAGILHHIVGCERWNQAEDEQQ